MVLRQSLLRLAVSVGVLDACGRDAAATIVVPQPDFNEVYQGVLQGSENGKPYSGVSVTLTLPHPPGNGFYGTWTSGASSGTLQGAYNPSTPTYITFVLTQTSPCPGMFYDFGNAGIRASDGLVSSLGG